MMNLSEHSLDYNTKKTAVREREREMLVDICGICGTLGPFVSLIPFGRARARAHTHTRTHTPIISVFCSDVK